MVENKTNLVHNRNQTEQLISEYVIEYVFSFHKPFFLYSCSKLDEN